MLAEAVIASYENQESDGYHKGQLTVTGVSPCAYATYINYKHLDDEGFDAESRLRMKNGQWQELEILEDLRHAGFTLKYTGSNQLMVNVGPIRGKPDGLIVVDSKEDLLEIKSMSLNMYTELKQKGLRETFPGYYNQVQLYMASKELRDRVSGCWFYAKHKDTCRPYDIFVPKDLTYSGPIIEAVTKIVSGGTIDKPQAIIPLCTRCRHKLFCWKVELLDTSGIGVVYSKEAVNLWLQGQFHLDMGKEFNEEARVLLKQALGDNDVVYCQGEDSLLQVRKITQHRSEVDISKFVQTFGAHRLPEVMTEKIVEQVRVTLKE